MKKINLGYSILEAMTNVLEGDQNNNLGIMMYYIMHIG